MKKIWVYAEQTSGVLNDVALELLTKAGELAKSYKEETEIAAVLVGNNVKGLADKLAEYGASKVFLAEDNKLNLYAHTTYAPLIADLIKKEDPDVFLFGATAIGSELAPTIAVIVKTGVAAHCVDMYVNDEGLMVSDVPSFGGKIIGEILVPKHRPQMASVKPGIFTKSAAAECACAKANIVEMDMSSLEKANMTLKPTGVHIVQSKSIPIEQADVVVVGGYGTQKQENWDMMVELAELLGGAAGATRPAVDEGWAPGEQVMIGTSGKSIRPKNYIGFGLSGSTHHICGMKDSGLVISVNIDDKAPIFEMSNYYAVHDLEALLPELIKLVKAAKKK